MVTWNLDDLYKPAQEQSLLHELKTKSEKFARTRTELGAGLTPKRFMEIFALGEEIDQIAARLSAYAELRFTENTNDSARIAHQTRIQEVITDCHNKNLFFMLWFKSIDDTQAKRYIASSGRHRFYLERVRLYRPYTLSEKEEVVISLKDLTGDKALTSLYDQIHNAFLFPWKGKKVTQEEIMRHVRSSRRKDRERAYTTVLTRYKQEKVLGELYKYLVNAWKNEHIKLRGFKSLLAPRNLQNMVSDDAVEVLLRCARKNAPLFQEYFTLKGKLLKLSRMSRFDLYAPLSTTEKRYKYGSAKDIVLSTYTAFDERMGAMARMVFDQNHVHSDVTPGKRSGAFCYSVLPSITPYVMVNQADRLDDLFTLMHEVGHAIHSIAAREQTDYTFHAPLPIAETASVFGEMILARAMLRDASQEEKIHILLRAIDSQYATIMRQAYFVIFEKKAHEMIAQGATVEDLDKEYYLQLSEMFGKSMDIPELFAHEWKYIPHIYHTPFYCYAYAFGNLLVLALYKKYEQEGSAFIPKYLRILSWGGAATPKDILREVGIDINDERFWQGGFDVIREEIELLKKLSKHRQ